MNGLAIPYSWIHRTPGWYTHICTHLNRMTDAALTLRLLSGLVKGTITIAVSWLHVLWYIYIDQPKRAVKGTFIFINDNCSALAPVSVSTWGQGVANSEPTLLPHVGCFRALVTSRHDRGSLFSAQGPTKYYSTLGDNNAVLLRTFKDWRPPSKPG